MSLVSAIVHNFQNHKRTVIKFNPGVNAIVGPSDVGKSAFFRSLIWAITNRPSGDSFRSDWGGDVSVELEFGDGIVVLRKRDDSNSYQLLNSDGEVLQEYRAFKGDIPEDIQKALNLDDINIQSQLDPPFLLADKSGDIAKLLNRISNLEDMDKAVAAIRHKVRATNNEIGFLEKSIEELEEKKQTYSNLPEIERKVKRYEDLGGKETELYNGILGLEKSVNSIEESQVSLKLCDEILKSEEKIKEALELNRKAQDLTNKMQAISSQIKNITEDEKDLDSCTVFLRSEPQVNQGVKLKEALSKILEKERGLQAITQLISSKDRQLDSFVKQIQDLEESFENEFPDVCPLCGSEK